MKTIDATLLAHKAQSSTTLTDLLLIGPLDDDTYRGFSLLDQDVTFTPSGPIGAITFKARTGFEMSALESTNDMGVNNAEATTLPPVVGFEMEGFTQTQIDSGALDKVKFVVLRVNYNDLTTGRSEVIAGGTIGEVKVKFGGLTVLELRSLAQQLRQKSIVQLDSTTCRAQFGSGAIGSGAEIEERFPCGFDAAATWISGEVTSVGGETDRQFSDTTLLQADDYFAPGKVEWLTGDNAGQQVEIESFASGIVELKFPTVSAIQDGDTFQIRRQCTKRWTGHNSCDTYWAADKPLHFRAEPHLPVGQSSSLSVPGVGVPTGVGGGAST